MESSLRSRVAVVIPCLNEARTIESVVASFKSALPEAQIVVADNGSQDDTREIAVAAGATVLTERRRGKGWALRKAFADIDADCYLMVDGDATYDASFAREMADWVLKHRADMVIGVRTTSADTEELAYRRGHQFGNSVLTWSLSSLFGLSLRDALSGYRALSPRMARTFVLASEGFEVETDLNVHAATLGVDVVEIETPYKERPEGSTSKLRTYRDGWRIAKRNLTLYRDARPMAAFFALSLPWLIASALLIAYVLNYYFRTGLVENFPSLIAGVGCFLVFLNTLTVGLILSRISRMRTESQRIAYLNFGR